MEAENSKKNFKMFVQNSRKERNRRKLPGHDNAVEVMEQHIWKRIPEDILEAIIARLPVTTFFRFRSVCRKWNALLYSQSFSQLCAQVPQTVPWFYINSLQRVMGAYNVGVYKRVMGAMYDPSLKTWHNPTISIPITQLVTCASAGGLVCVSHISGQHIFVGNPLTRSFRKLPLSSLELLFSVVVGIIVNVKSTSQEYKVLRVDYYGNYEIYDSTKNAWCRHGKTPLSIKLPLSSLLFPPVSLSVNNTVYFMRSEPQGIMSFNMETETWKQFIVPAPEDLRLEDNFLAECDGRIMLVGLLSKSVSICIYIWELQKTALLWKEVDRMPNELCLEYCDGWASMTCLGNKSLLMMLLQSKQMDIEVTYDARKREWLRVPIYTIPPLNNRQRVTSGTSFYPSLSAVP